MFARRKKCSSGSGVAEDISIPSFFSMVYNAPRESGFSSAKRLKHKNKHRCLMRGNDSKAPSPVLKTLPPEVHEQNFLIDIVVVRLIFAITLTLVAYYSHPFGLQGPSAVAVGIAS